MGVLSVQSVVPFMDLVTPAGTTPPYAITLPKVTVEADVPLPPNVVKIDVEGGEPAVLAGLAQAVPALSFEYLPRAIDQVQACLARLSRLGPYRFNWSPGESYRLATSSWLNERELLASLMTPGAPRRAGDVYARLAGPRPA